MPCSLVGESPSICGLRDRLGVIARTQPGVTILITGPSGSGKELVAREIHCLNARTRRGAFVPVDLSYVPRELAGSRLFGHERGAFTDARERRPGAFEEGRGGTVFLDEVSSITLEFQGMFLRVLQEREFAPLGSTKVFRTDARIIAASNENLWDKVQAGFFRQDLYFRLKVLEVLVPSLSERTEDIPLLVRHFIVKHAPQVGCDPGLAVDDEVFEALARRPWPGNVRQLENVIIHSLALAIDDTVLRASHLPPQGPEETGGRASPVARDLLAMPYPEAQRESLRRFKISYWTHRLHESGGSIAKTARGAGILPSSLHRMVSELGLKGRYESGQADEA